MPFFKCHLQIRNKGGGTKCPLDRKGCWVFDKRSRATKSELFESRIFKYRLQIRNKGGGGGKQMPLDRKGFGFD